MGDTTRTPDENELQSRLKAHGYQPVEFGIDRRTAWAQFEVGGELRDITADVATGPRQAAEQIMIQASQLGIDRRIAWDARCPVTSNRVRAIYSRTALEADLANASVRYFCVHCGVNHRASADELIGLKELLARQATEAQL